MTPANRSDRSAKRASSLTSRKRAPLHEKIVKLSGAQIDLAIAGGGPAGVMAGLLFARAGCTVQVLEKHADFFRDFRGDTVHPSTLELLRELGLIDEFLKRPHDEVRTLTIRVADRQIGFADMGHLPVKSRFVALMPQWDFLDRSEARR